MIIDNPAKRLLGFLAEAQNINKDTTCLAAWHRLLKVDKAQKTQLLSRFGKVITLPQQTLDTLEQIDPTLVKYQNDWVIEVSNAFQKVAHNQKWELFLKYITSVSINGVAMASSRIDAHAGSKENLSVEDLNELRELISSLVTETLNSENIDESIRIYLVRKFHEILISIDEYFLTGSIPITDAVNSVVGAAATNQNLQNEMKTSFGDDIFLKLGKFNTLNTFVHEITNLSFKAAEKIPFLAN